MAALVLAPLPALAAYLAQIKQPELLSFIAVRVSRKRASSTAVLTPSLLSFRQASWCLWPPLC